METLNAIVEKYVNKVNEFEPERNSLSGKKRRLEYMQTIQGEFCDEIDKECQNLEKKAKEDLKIKANQMAALFLKKVTL